MKFEADLYDDKVLVRVCRGVLGMSQKQFGNLLGVRNTIVSLWERGHKPVSKKHRPLLIKILRSMNQEVKWFLAQENERFSKVRD
jgi:DNA-binding transcriptional regulator YiaG